MDERDEYEMGAALARMGARGQEQREREINATFSVRGLDPAIVKRMRHAAIEQGRPMREIIAEACSDWLVRHDG